MNPKRVLVMNAPSGVYCRDDRCQDRIDDFLEPVYRTPLEILYQAAILRKLNIEFKVKDYSLEHKNWTHLKQDIEQFNPTHVVFNRNIFEQYPKLDIAIMGEFEETFRDYFLDAELEKLKGIVFRKNNEIV